jgi:putative ABC transport system permease protein
MACDSGGATRSKSASPATPPFAPSEDDDFSIRNMEEIFAAQEASSRIMSIMLAAVASVSPIVGGIGIMNIMLVSVR